MAFWRNGKGGEPSTSLVPVARPVEQTPPPREEYDEADIVWRCRCGSMGASRDSLLQHIAPARRCGPADVREYVPREVYEEEYEATAQELSASGIWIVVQMPVSTPEGSIQTSRAAGTPDISAEVFEAASGLEAIQLCYTSQIDRLNVKSTEIERNAANGRYVAIDFFTGHRCEALVESEWRANVDVAEGSHR